MGLQMMFVNVSKATYTTPVVPKYVAISFESNGGTKIDELSVPYNDKVFDLPVPFKEGYRFDGWYEERYFLARWEDGSIARTNFTLFAKWTAVQEIPVFSDIQSHWAKETIEEMAAQGIIAGYEDGTFRPNEPVLRKHIATMLDRTTIPFPLKQEMPHFNDVPTEHAYYEAIMALANAGIIDGYKGNYNPDAPMTRAELAKVLVLAFGLTPRENSSFADVSPTHWSAPYIAALVNAGIAVGDNGNFLPNEPVTRAQFVTFLYHALNL